MQLIIGYDGSQFADAALEDLQRAGLPTNTQALVLSAADVFAPRDAEPPDSTPAAAPIERARQRVNAALDEARSLAERAAARVRHWFPNWRVSTEAVADSAAWAILQRAAALPQSPPLERLIAVGAAGRGALGRAVFGSTSHQVLLCAPCSVRIGRVAREAGATPTRLLIGVDGSDGARLAVEAVAARSWPAGTECRILSATDPRIRPTATSTPEQHAQSHAEAAEKTLRARGLTTTLCITDANPARALVDEANRWSADCVFVGGQGQSRWPHYMLGSVSTAVAMRAGCAVEVVHAATARG